MNGPIENARVWRLGADIDTDVLAPGGFMKHGLEVIGWHCLEAVRSDFASGVRAGDVIVAGPNFGIGSSREQAAGVLRHLGLAAVIAPSFSGLYFRNAFNLGLLLLTCERATEIQEGERIAVRYGLEAFEQGYDVRRKFNHLCTLLQICLIHCLVVIEDIVTAN